MSKFDVKLCFPRVGGREVVVSFDGGEISSDAGLLLLAEADRRLGLTARLAECLVDHRQSAKVEQTFHDMLRQRVFGIACGYSDQNDFDTLRSDPIHKLAVGRGPADDDLASQPTLSRFENSVGRTDLLRLAEAMLDGFILRHRGRPPREIILDADATDDPTHGQQELSFYHGFYECHCYLPLLVYAQADGDEQELVASVLRPGNVHAGRGVENRIKELKLDLESGRTSCHRFLANQFRLMLHAAAFVLLQFIRSHLQGTELARAQCHRLRLCLLKVGARVRQSARRIWLQLPSSYPWQDFWPWLVPQPAQ